MLRVFRRSYALPSLLEARFSEPDGKLMVLVIADTGTLMIYEGTTLKWSAQLPFTPVAVARAQLRVSGVEIEEEAKLLRALFFSTWRAL